MGIKMNYILTTDTIIDGVVKTINTAITGSEMDWQEKDQLLESGRLKPDFMSVKCAVRQDYNNNSFLPIKKKYEIPECIRNTIKRFIDRLP